MKKYKANKILGLITIGINVLLIINALNLYYCYNFCPHLIYLFMYPNWVLLVNALLGIVGIFISILLYKNKIRIKLFLIVTLTLWLVTLSNYYFPIY
jgi:ABC-type multidrug transport system permease subunit